jgi:hypothetical protein
MHLTIPNVKDVIVGELAERGEWIVANIQTSSFWPVNTQKVHYRWEMFWILPEVLPGSRDESPEGQEPPRM